MTVGNSFFETQTFREKWLWLILIFFGTNVWLFKETFDQMVQHIEVGNKPMSNMELISTTVLVTILTILFLLFKLETRIEKDGIYIRFFPFHLSPRKYSWDKIEKSYVRQYSPLREYGGWGIRFGLFGKGMAYNVSGDMGIQLVFKDGTKVLIGTNKPQEVEEILRRKNLN